MEQDIKVVNFALGAGGRRFESFCPDLLKTKKGTACRSFFRLL